MDVRRIEVIAPQLKRRLSGVTATVVRLVPLQARDIAIAATGPMPKGVPHLPLLRVVTMPRRGPRGPRVWHARRNSEMLLGVLLRDVLRKRLKLVFTSASQRHHTRYTKWLIRRMDAVVATSAKTAGYLEVPSRVVLHGIDAGRFAPAPDRAALRARLGLPAEGPLIGCFGRIRAQKGTGDFIEAMARLLPGRPGTAILLGRATERHQTYRRELEDRIAGAGLAGRIRLLPEVPVTQIADWYAALDLFVAPQRWEGFGLTPLEAMASGVPVVATRVGAFEDLLPDPAWLVPPEDPAALAATIGRALDSDLAAAGAAARAHVLAHHRLESEAAALTALYRELLP